MSAPTSGPVALLRRHVLLVVAVALLAASAVVLVQAQAARGRDNVGNRAVVDTAATNDVKAEVGSALVRVFSYDYADPAPTEQAADQLLAGKAREQYDLLFTTLQEKAPGQQLVLTAQVQVAAVQELRGDTARLMVFLDQASQRVTDQQASVSAAQVVVDARREGTTWKLTNLRPL